MTSQELDMTPLAPPQPWSLPNTATEDTTNPAWEDHSAVELDAWEHVSLFAALEDLPVDLPGPVTVPRSSQKRKRQRDIYGLSRVSLVYVSHR